MGGLHLSAQIIDFPDNNLKNALVNFNVVDINGDGNPDADADLNNNGEIEVDEAEAVIHLDLWNLDISDITGLEYFVNLESLDLYNNNIVVLETSTMTELKYLDAQVNDIEQLDLTNNLDLEFIWLNDNNLSGHLDFSQNTKVETLSIAINPVNSINVSSLVDLKELSIYNALLEEIDISNNLDLINLYVSHNSLTEIDIQLNNNLEALGIGNNEISEIDVSHLEQLKYFSAQENQITQIDVSNNPNLLNLKVRENNLTSLNLKNGNNELLEIMTADLNPNLNCIQVDDQDMANSIICDEFLTEYWCKDETSSYSENCALSGPDFASLEVVLYPNPATNFIQLQTELPIESVQIFDLSGTLVLETSTTGIDISHILSGLYFLRVNTNSMDQTIKFVKR